MFILKIMNNIISCNYICLIVEYQYAEKIILQNMSKCINIYMQINQK